MLAEPGTMLMLSRVAGETVNAVLSQTLPMQALMSAEPAVRPAATPALETVAMVLLSEPQMTPVLKS